MQDSKTPPKSKILMISSLQYWSSNDEICFPIGLKFRLVKNDCRTEIFTSKNIISCYVKDLFLILLCLFLVSFGAYQEEGPRGDQAQVHRHQLQDGSWSFPNQKGQNGLYGTSQKGYRQGRSSCLICFLNMLCLENTEFIMKIYFQIVS